MNHIYRKVYVKFITLGLCLFFLPLTGSYAAAGCCSHHGGVNGCNTSNNHQLCKDGTSSPTCLCSGGTTTNATQTKSKVSKKTTTANTQTSNSSEGNAATPSTTQNTTTTTSSASNASTTASPAPTTNKIKGCCSKHGGVSKCDTATGYQICKDGTHSTTCKC